MKAYKKIIILLLIIAVLVFCLILVKGNFGSREVVVAERNSSVVSNGQEHTESDVSGVSSETNSDADGLWKMGGPEVIPLDAESYHATWDEMVDKGWVERSLLGYPSNGDKEYPVYMYKLNPNADYLGQHYDVKNGKLYDRPRILITSGFHGSEKGAPEFLRNVIEDMMTDPELASIAVRYEWDIIPLVNPWGYSHSLLKNGVLHNGQVYDNFNGYKVVENGEYNQGVRLNASQQDCNRDWHDGPGGCPSEEAKLVRDVLVSGNYDFVIDMHQTKNTTACGFISIGNKSNSMSDSNYEKVRKKLYTAAAQAGIETDRLVSDYYSMDTIEQTAFPWEGTNDSNFRNYASGYTAGGSRRIDVKNAPKYSICFEISMYCPQYSGNESETAYNSAANTYGNTFIHHFILRLEDLL